MSWSGDFIDLLGRASQAPVVWVHPLNTQSGYGDPAYSLGSIPGVGSDTAALLVGLRTIGQELQVRTWTTTLGGFSFRVVPTGPTGDVLPFIEACPRGTVLGLYVDLDGSGMHQVGTGVVSSVVHAFEGARYAGTVVTCVDVPRAMQGRLTNATGAHPLFYTIGPDVTGSTTTLTSDAAVAAGSYAVADASAFPGRLGGSYPYGAVLVSTSLGDAYWRLWSANGTTTLTITGAATASLMGTTDVGASAGDTVTAGWYLTGHPLDIAREVLVSRTGDGSAGLYDRLPEGWGIGMSDALIDHQDIDAWKASDLLTPASGSYLWQIAGTDRVDDPWGWLTDWLGRAGYFLAMRQGLVTVRPAQNLNSSRISTEIAITDSDIASVEGGSVWDPTVDREYYQCRVVSVAHTSNVLSAVMSSLPAGDWYDYDVSDRLWANETAVCNMEAARLSLAVVAIPETVRLTCAGLRLAVLTLGDMVYLDTSLIPSRSRGVDGYLTQRAMVTYHAVDWMRGVVVVGLTMWPIESEV